MWACSRGWADLERNVPLDPGHRFPALTITTLVTSTAVLCLVAEGAVALDDPVNGHLRSLRLADDAVTVRELLSHTGGVDSPPSVWAEAVADVADVLGPVVGLLGTARRVRCTATAATRCSGSSSPTSPEPRSRRRRPGSSSNRSAWPTRGSRRRPRSRRTRRAATGSSADGSFEPEPPPVFALQSAGGLWSTGPDLVRFGSGWRTLLPGELAEQALRPHARQYDSAAEIGLGWLLSRPDGSRRPRRRRAGFVGLADHPSEHGPHQRCADQPAGPVEPANARLIRLVA